MERSNEHPVRETESFRHPSLKPLSTVYVGPVKVQVEAFLRYGPPLGTSIPEYYLVSNISRGTSVSHTLRVMFSASPALAEAVLAEIELLEAIHGLCTRNPKHIGNASDYIVRLESYSLAESVDVVTFPSPRLYTIFCIFDDPELRTLEEIISYGDKGEPYRFDEDGISNILNQICRAVLILHCFKWGLVHRNINLHNIVEVAPERFKLSGLLSVSWELRHTMRPLPLGGLMNDITCYTDEDWRSPEMQNPSPSTEITTKSDVWSLGVLLYQLKVGRDLKGYQYLGRVDSWRHDGATQYGPFHSILSEVLLERPEDRLTVNDFISLLPETRTTYSIILSEWHGELKDFTKYLVPRKPFLPYLNERRGLSPQYFVAPQYMILVPAPSRVVAPPHCHTSLRIPVSQGTPPASPFQQEVHSPSHPLSSPPVSDQPAWFRAEETHGRPFVPDMKGEYREKPYSTSPLPTRKHRDPENSVASGAPRLLSSSSTRPARGFEDLTRGSALDVAHDVGNFISSISLLPVNVNGHFCDLFKGLHKTAGLVALKRPRVGGDGYDESVIRRFEREATTWKRLKHRHILEFIGTFKCDGHFYLVSPFVENGTLAEYISRHPNVHSVRLLCETADAINYLHTEGVVHGDIKARNVLISGEVSALLCDFGLTRMMDSRTSTSMKGAGSIRWMAPELWDNVPKSPESDTYAFGMTIAEVLKGEVPLGHISNNVAVMMAVITKDERPSKSPTHSPSGTSYGTAWAVAEACWRRNPSERISIREAYHLLRGSRSTW